MNVTLFEGHACINSGQLKDALGVSISAEFITEKTRVTPQGKIKAATMWRVADVGRICDGLAAHFDQAALDFSKLILREGLT